MRFEGNGNGNLDRVNIKLDNPARPIDVGGDFSLEWWMKAYQARTSPQIAAPAAGAWLYGNTIFDRDVYGQGITVTTVCRS